jgi:hypothetical protein
LVLRGVLSVGECPNPRIFGLVSSDPKLVELPARPSTTLEPGPPFLNGVACVNGVAYYYIEDIFSILYTVAICSSTS